MKILVACAIIGAGAFWFITRPAPLITDFGAGLTPDPDNGALVFTAGGCVSCHAAPQATGGDRLVLKGGRSFESEFGTFYAPNISTDTTHGIGSWQLDEFAHALTAGVSPQGQHLYPAFPYTAYTHLAPQDVVDLFAHLQTLPADATPSKAHDVSFPFNIRRLLGGWKFLYLREDYVVQGDLSDQVARGRYLAEALAHCGECHTPRNALGGLDRAKWLSGAPNPSGEGRIPNITPGALDWSESDLVEYFTSGFTPDYDSVGGEMAEVVTNLGGLPESDRAAIAAYLKAVPALQ